MDLKNQTLKTRKCQEKYLSKLKNNLCLDDNIELKNDVWFINNYTEDAKNLVIENYSDFKLIQKEKTDSHSTSVDKTMKTDSKNTMINSKTKVQEKDIENSGISSQNNNNDSKEILNEYKKDLQSLLIMMAINKNTDAVIESDKETCITNRSLLHQSNYRPDIEEQSSDSDLNKILYITPAVTKIRERQKYLSMKYTRLWRIYVNKKKEIRMYEQRRETLNIFFEKLAKKKCNANNNESELVQKSRILARDYNTYQHR